MRVFRLLAAVCAVLMTSVAGAQEVGRLHHVHLNVTDVEKTTEFYQRHFGVPPIKYNGTGPALLLEQSFLFLNRVGPGTSILNHQLTGLTHVAWSTADGNVTYQRLKSQGVEFYTPVEELLPGSTYMYLYGPDREVIELSDFARHHRYNHIHVVAKDDKAAEETARWFHALTNYDKPVVQGPLRNWNVSFEGVSFTVFPIGARFTPRENDGTLRNTDGSHLDHIAFSFCNLTAAYERIQKQGVAIVRPMAVDQEYGFRHFFVRAPNGVLVELVEAAAWPAAAWERCR